MVPTAICRNTPRRKQRWDQCKGEASSKQSITGASYTIYTPANDHLEFRTIGERESATQARGQGFA